MRGKPNISVQGPYRCALSLLTFGIAVYAGGDTARIAPFAFGALVMICLGLLIFHGARYVNLIFLQLSLLLIFCYDSFDTFVKFVWIAPLVLLAFAVHLCRLRPRLRFGPSLLPLMLVALATVLGGVGTLTTEEYFRPVVLAYVVGLGPGLVLTYLLMKNEYITKSDEHALIRDLFWWGLTASAVVLVHTLPPLFRGEGMPVLQWSNNVSTMLMIAMPAVTARVRHRVWLFPLPVLLAAAMMLSGSRAGMLFAPVELIACLVWLVMVAEKRRVRIFHLCWIAVMAVAALIWAIPFVLNLIAENADGLFRPIDANDSRWKLILRALEDFRDNPLFGSGLGYQGNIDIYNGKMGTINWYHVFPAQVLGGLGIVGVLAWGYQLVTRLLLAIRVRKKGTFALALCYGGLLLMSMVNPGEFCPVPYAFLAVTFFALLENRTFGANTRLWFVPRAGAQEGQAEENADAPKNETKPQNGIKKRLD